MSGERATSGALEIDQTEDVRSAGPFAQIGVSPSDRVRFTAGVRWDYYNFRAGDRKLDDGDQSGDRKMDAFSPSVGMTVAAAPNVNLFTSFATAYETPTTVELSNTPTGEGGFNQELGPRTSAASRSGFAGWPRRPACATRRRCTCPPWTTRSSRSRARPRRSSFATPASRPATASSCCSSGSRTPPSAPGSPIVGIDNLFNELYNSSTITNAFGGRYNEPSPDREYYVGLTIGGGPR